MGFRSLCLGTPLNLITRAACYSWYLTSLCLCAASCFLPRIGCACAVRSVAGSDWAARERVARSEGKEERRGRGGEGTAGGERERRAEATFPCARAWTHEACRAHACI